MYMSALKYFLPMKWNFWHCSYSGSECFGSSLREIILTSTARWANRLAHIMSDICFFAVWLFVNIQVSLEAWQSLNSRFSIVKKVLSEASQMENEWVKVPMTWIFFPYLFSILYVQRNYDRKLKKKIKTWIFLALKCSHFGLKVSRTMVMS